MTVKLKGPHNHGGMSHEGTSYGPDENGHIDVPDHVIPLAFAHGFEMVGEADEAPVNFTKLNKKQLVAFATDNLGLELDESRTAKELIAAIEAALEAKA